MNEIRFDDGEAYERFMGRWSRPAGEVFLDWIAPPPGLRWLDVGCGNGAFTALLLERTQAAHVTGIDPSAGQLRFAEARLRGRPVEFHRGGAEELPFPAQGFDAAAMALVIFFVPEPERGVAEMVRVVRPGGLVAAYAWDILGGGFPIEPLMAPLRALGIEPLRPPRADVSTNAALEGLWRGARLERVTTRSIEVERRFDSFDDWWSSLQGASSLAAAFERLSPEERARLQVMVREQNPTEADGGMIMRARANAVAGYVPASSV